MMLRKKNAKFIALFIIALSIVSCNSTKETTNFKPLANAISTNMISDSVSADPTDVKTENGTTCYIYENSKYADYIGTTTYYCAEDQVMLSRWAYDVEEDEDRGDVYNDILAALEEEYGSFTKGDNDVTYTLKTEKEMITLESFSVENGYNIVITCN